MMRPSSADQQRPGISKRLLDWNLRFKAQFPTRLVGELHLTEADFRALLADVREYGQKQSLQMPPSSFFPRLTLVIMTFTARYDYEGAFWPAFTRNIGLESVDQAEWGAAFRRTLIAFKLFSPPEHWMVNVFPVLFHSIVPERSLEDFALMVRALCDSVDIRLLDDQTLAEAIESAEVPILLRRFVSGRESRAVAHELVRHVAEDFRLGADTPDDTLRGRILATMRSANASRLKAFDVRIQPLAWRWDFNNGRCGAWLSTNRFFETAPVALEVDGHTVKVRSQHAVDGWQITPQILSLPTSTAAKRGAITSYGEQLLQVRVGSAPSRAPFIFRSVGSAGVFEPGDSSTSGDFAIAGTPETRVVTARGQDIPCIEVLSTPLLRGVETAAIYSLSEGDRVVHGDRCIFTVRRATRPSVELRGRTSWVTSSPWGETPVYAESPRLELRSPEPNSAFLLFEGSQKTPLITVPFEDVRQVRPDVREGTSYRCSIAVDGRSAGTSAVEFVILPMRSELHKDDSKLALRLFGQGSISIANRVVELHPDTPTTIAFAELYAAERISYEFSGRIYALRYSGPRPTLWGIDRDALDNTSITIRVDSVIASSRVYVSGMPGDAVSLELFGTRLDSDEVDADGLAILSLAKCIPIARARDRIDVYLTVNGSSLPAFTILSAPQVTYDGILASSHHVTGIVCLDHPVEQLSIEARVFHMPWIPVVVVSFEGASHTWSINTILPEQHWELSLVGTLSGARVAILRDGALWSRSCGTAADRRTSFDESLYDALIRNDDDANFDSLFSYPAADVAQHCLTLLALDRQRRERPRIEQLLRFCAERLRVIDITSVEHCLARNQAPALLRIAAQCGLPVAAFDNPPSDVPGFTSQDSASKAFQWFARTAASGRSPHDDASLAQVLTRLATHEDPLIVAYARLLRQLRTPAAGTEERLSEAFRSRQVLEAYSHAQRYGDVAAWTDASPEQTSSFAIIVKRTWGLATIARRVGLLDPSSAIPSAVRIMSILLYDDLVGDLAHLTLSWVDKNIKVDIRRRQ